MKKIIVILLFVFIFVSCKTKEQIEEDAKQKAQKISKVTGGSTLVNLK